MRRVTTRVLLFISVLLGAGIGSGPSHAAPATRLTLFAGTQGGYVFASANGGAAWQERNIGLPTGADITALAAASGVVYAGTTIAGVYISRDQGATWSAYGDPPYQDGTSVRALAVDPRDVATVFAGLDSGNIFKESNGVWQALPVPTGSGITALAILAGSPETIVAGTRDDGLLISRDGGGSWQAPDQNVPAGEQVNALAVDAQSATVVYAATSDGLYQSIDAGASWQPERRGIPPGADLLAVAVDPRDGARVLAGDADGILYRSDDGGTHWEATPGSADTQINALIFDPTRTGVVLVALANGGVSVFDTADWRSWLSEATVVYLGASSVLCLVAATQAVLPTDRVAPPGRNLAGLRYFPQTGHLVVGAFLQFYDRYGGLKIFGLPLTESFVEDGQVVQYFERARLLLAPGGVQVSPLGFWLTDQRRFPTTPPFAPASDALYFPATHHSLRGSFLAFWRNHHGALLFGSPISEPLHEQNGDGTGRVYLVQYFANARMEYHPELSGTRYTVTLGLLGQQYLRRRGWL